MKERPIRLKPHEVAGVLAGRQTQVRRILKVQPPSDKHKINLLMCSTAREDRKNVGKLHWQHVENLRVIHSDNNYFTNPYGAIGDRLWVRETWALNWASKDYESGHYDDFGNVSRSRLLEIKSLSDLRSSEFLAYAADDGWEPNKDDRVFNWKPSIHMPRWASRITLEITGVRVERLQDISEEDAIAEGAQERPAHGMMVGNLGRAGHWQYRQGFRELWEQINGAESWAANPYVWVIDFTKES